jgi:hypothetical protein
MAPCINHVFTNATATVSGETGSCTCLPATLTRDAQGTDTADWTTTDCTGSTPFALDCVDGFYVFSALDATAVLVSFTESPFELVYDLTWPGLSIPCVGTARITITDP